MLYIGLLRLVRHITERLGPKRSGALVALVDRLHRRHVQRILETAPTARWTRGTVNVTVLPPPDFTAADLARELVRSASWSTRRTMRRVYKNMPTG